MRWPSRWRSPASVRPGCGNACVPTTVRGALIRNPEQNLAAAFVGQSHAVSKQFIEMVVVPRFLELDACTFGRFQPLPELLP